MILSCSRWCLSGKLNLEQWSWIPVFAGMTFRLNSSLPPFDPPVRLYLDHTP